MVRGKRRAPSLRGDAGDRATEEPIGALGAPHLCGAEVAAVGHMTEYLTTAEAAALLRRSPLTIRRRCEQGAYTGAFKDAGSWRIPRSDLLPRPAPEAPRDRALARR